MIVSGIVEVGAGRGTNEFVPTLNLLLHENLPVNFEYGVYACKALVLGEWCFGVMHYGPRTSVDNLITFEVNLFDFKNQVYGEEVKVEILDYIRPIIKFENLTELKQQINSDILQAKIIHKI